MLAYSRLLTVIVAICLVAGIIFVGMYFHFATKNNTENQSTSTAQQPPIQQPTAVPNATTTSQTGMPDQQNPIPQSTGPATATIDQYSLQTNSSTPTISGVYDNTYGLEVVIAKTHLPQKSLLNDSIPGVVWDDVSDHGGEVNLVGTNSGTFSDHVTKALPDGTYYVGIYSDVLFYPRTDENVSKEYRQLLDNAVLTIQHTQ